MRKNRTRLSTLSVLAISLLTLVLSACGDSTATPAAATTVASTTTSAATTNAATTTSAVTTVAATTPSAVAATTAATTTAASTTISASSTVAGSGKTITIQWWGFASQQNTQELITAYEAIHPNIKIVYKFQEHEPYLQSLKLAVASGNAPDLFDVEEGGMLKEYSEFLEDLTPYMAKAEGANWSDRFVPVSLKSEQLGGKTYGLPYQVNAAGYLWYNKTIFDKYGLKPPTTFDEWQIVSKELQAKGITPFVQGAKDSWQNLDLFLAIANQVAPGKFYDAQDGKISWTDPNLIKAMDIWAQTFKSGTMQKGALGLSAYPDAFNEWASGKAAMIFLGTWNNNVMNKTTIAGYQKQFGYTDNYEFLPVLLPKVSADSQSPKLFGGSGGADGINKNSPPEVKQAAFDFIHWLTLPDGGEKIFVKQGDIPDVKGITVDSSDIMTDAQKSALQQESVDLNSMAGIRQVTYPELETALGTALQNVASDQQTSQQALQQVQTVSQGIQR